MGTSMMISIRTADGVTYPLLHPGDCRGGIRLKQIPDGFMGFPVEHVWDEDRAARRAEHRRVVQGVQPMQLSFVVQGDDPGETAGEFIRAVRRGPLQVRVQVGESLRWVDAILGQVSEVMFHGLPTQSPLVTFGLLLEVGRPLWQMPPRSLVVTGSQALGAVNIPLGGDLPVYPTLTVTGTWVELRVRLTAEDTWQPLPHTPGGWTVVTDPAHRAVTDQDGQPLVGHVPFFPHPITHEGGQGTLHVEGEVGPDFTLTVTHIPEAETAW